MISELIDLTENRDFGGNSMRNITINSKDFWEQVIEDFNRKMYGKIIWKVEDDKCPPKFDGIFPLGNKQQRKESVEMYYWGGKNSVNCDCCGKKYIKIPWKFNSGLCKECSEDRNNKDINFPWL